MDTDRIVLGVDVGGTKIRYGLMDMEGTILADDQCRSRAMPCREWFSFITEKLDSFLKANPEGKAAQAIGLGIRGSIDRRWSGRMALIFAGHCRRITKSLCFWKMM